MSQKATFEKALRIAAERLRASGIDSAMWDARMVLAHVLKVGHMDIPLQKEAGDLEEFDALIARRAQREPLQHIVGTAPFGPLDLEVGEGVFIPRPETEMLADWAVNHLSRHHGRGVQPAPVVVDLCTGSGSLAAYIAHYRPDAHIVAVELSDATLPFTSRNLAGTSVAIKQADVTSEKLLKVLSDLVGKVDLLVTNPPYVPEDPHLDLVVYFVLFDAVSSGDDRMDSIKAMLPNDLAFLKVHGAVCIEHDDSPFNAVQQAAREAVLVNVSPLKDLGSTARSVLPHAPG